MITLNDYLYSGDTLHKILRDYTRDLKEDAIKTRNPIDMVHCNFLLQITEMLEHNHFLIDQSSRVHEFYSFLEKKYPSLAFTFKGRIKSALRAEAKFNGYIVEYIYDYYHEHGTYPSIPELKNKLNFFRDLIAYRFVISIPTCNLEPGKNKKEEEIRLLYEIANYLPEFLETRGFNLVDAGLDESLNSLLLKESVRPFYRDYVTNPRTYGYQSLHVTFYDSIARCYFEVQLRTKEMDDNAEIGAANHIGYKKEQEAHRARRNDIPEGENILFDEAYERGKLLRELELNKVDVNMFSAINDQLVNDACGLYRGRLILPFEHLSKFQHDFEK